MQRYADSARAREIIDTFPEWYHSIELAPGIVTPGRAPLDAWEATLKDLQLPDLHGKDVLDIGAYDGFYSFAAERLGARRVVALDEYVWSTDMQAYMREWREARSAGTFIESPRNSKHWQPETLPGRRPFDAVRSAFESRVEPVVGDFMNVTPADLGCFDVVLFLGVLYHMEEPLTAVRRVAEFLAPGGRLFIETEAIDIPGAPDGRFVEFFPANELNNDASNWWAPNVGALEGFMIAAGLVDCRIHRGPPRRSGLADLQRKVSRHETRFRAVASALKAS